MPTKRFTFSAKQEQPAAMIPRIGLSPIRGIIAALDGIAIEIMRPRAGSTPDARKYFNRKGFYSLCVQAAVGADYKFYFVSTRHAGGTHDSTAPQATKLYDLLQGTVLPEWATVAADDAYSNGQHIVTPYSGYGLSVMKDTFNFYLSSCRMILKQTFGILICQFGIFWSALRYDISIDTLIIMVACKLHNFIIDNSNDRDFRSIPVAEENNVDGSPIIHIQSLLHTEQTAQRCRQRGRENSMLRDKITERLHLLGFMRPRQRR